MTTTDGTRTYTMERLGQHNIADVGELFTQVYGRPQPVGFFERKYDTAYTGVTYIGFIAYDGQRQPVGFYGIIPTMLWYNGAAILAAQSADTMTHPDYRNMGLFTKLATLTYDLGKQEGILLVFGFPNQNSFPGLVNKLGWHGSEVLQRFTINVKGTAPLEKMAHKYPRLKNAYQRYKKWVLKDVVLPWRGMPNSLIADGHNGVYRDDNYLSYKTGYSPTTVIKLGNAVFWVKLQNGLQIGDMTGVEDDLTGAMKKLTALAHKLGLGQITFQVSPQTKLYNLFALRYPASASYPVVFKVFDEGMDLNNIKFTFADIDIF